MQKNSPSRTVSATLRRVAKVCRPWALLLAGMAAIVLLAFGGIPSVQRLEPVREVRDAIHRRDIDATALFYTESHMSFEAEAAIRDALEYPPVRQGK
jgi:hypothetical protein